MDAHSDDGYRRAGRVCLKCGYRVGGPSCRMATLMIRVFVALSFMGMSLALIAMLAAIEASVNVYDRMPIKCGHKLRDVCPSTGMHWIRK
jgi:hypothetical protein